jgi:putative sigma-54 modulation protein
MNISITFRHMTSSEAIKKHASDKLGKLQRFLRQPMTAKVTLSIDGLKQIAEARISSGGEHLEAKESGEDIYVAIDRIMAKLERQIRRDKGAAESKRRGVEKTAPAVAAPKKAARLAKKAPKAKAKTPVARKTAKKAR